MWDYIAYQFQSTSPVRGTTTSFTNSAISSVISIHVPREGDDRECPVYVRLMIQISIHVPREGDDKPAARQDAKSNDFNPRPP